jgi:signal transduction histidine kinase
MARDTQVRAVEHRIIQAISGCLDLTCLLGRIREVICCELGYVAGTAYLWDGARDALRRFHDDEVWAPKWLYTERGHGHSLPEGGFEGRKSPCVVGDGEDPWSGWARLRGAEQSGSVVLFPVGDPARPCAILCFRRPYAAQGPRPVSVGPTERELLFGQALRYPAIKHALRRERFHHLVYKIQEAGQAPSRLRVEATEFINRLLRAFDRSQWARPTMLSLQVVDLRRDVVRTIHTWNTPLSFRTSPAVQLRGDLQTQPGHGADIQAHIVQTALPEIIVGNDRRRFNQSIFEQYGHDGLVRLWVPLVPVPKEVSFELGHATIDDLLREHLEWGPGYEDELCRCRRGMLSERLTPPNRLVFGTIEFGFERGEGLDLLPLDDDLATWCVARSWESAREMYRFTLQGSIDKIGRIATTAARSSTSELTCYFQRGLRLARWRYPTRSPWVAVAPVPAEGEVVSDDKLPDIRLGDEQELVGEGSTADPVGVGLSRSERVRRLTNLAVRTAFSTEEVATRPYDLSDPAMSDDPFGTMGTSSLTRIICWEACRDHGATRVALLQADPDAHQESKESRGSRPLLTVVPPATWAREAEQRDFSPPRSWFEQAGLVLDSRRPSYTRVGTNGFAVVPLTLDDGMQAVLAMDIDDGALELANHRERLERNVAGWSARLSRLRALQESRFQRLMAQLRRGVLSARQEALNAKGQRVPHFVEAVLRSFQKLLSAEVVIFTDHIQAATGPSRTSRTWCLAEAHDESLLVKAPLTRNRKPETPCLLGFESGKIELVHAVGPVAVPPHDDLPWQVLKHARDACGQSGHRIPKSLETLMGMGKVGWTMLVLPATGISSPGPVEQVAVSVLMKGHHFFGCSHRLAIEELQRLLGSSVMQLRERDELLARERHARAVEWRRRSIATYASDIDDITKYVFRGLGRVSESRVSPWQLADHAVVWVLDARRGEMVARSIRGGALGVLRQHGLLRCQRPHLHPMLRDDGCVLLTRGNNYAKLKEGGGNHGVRSFHIARLRDDFSEAYCDLPEISWLLSFCVADAGGRVFGIIDLLRDQPLAPEDERALGPELRRLGRHVSAGVERLGLRAVRAYSEDVFRQAMLSIGHLRTQDVYRNIVDRLADVFEADQVDLFLESFGRLNLLASTCLEAPPEQRSGQDTSIDLGGQVLPERTTVLHAGERDRRWKALMDEASPNLRPLLAGDDDRERLVVPFRVLGSDGRRARGLVRVCRDLPQSGPWLGQGAAASGTSRNPKRTGIYTVDEVHLAHDLERTTVRVIQIAQLVEQQSRVFRELVHSLAQPLHASRASLDALVRIIVGNDLWSDEVASALEGADEAFERVKEARERLQLVARLLGAPASRFREFGEVNLARLVRAISEMVQPQGTNRGISVDLTGVERIAPLPLDGYWMRNALFNLLENAVKYSFMRRKVTVALEEREDASVVLTVSNWGVGIPKEDLTRVFEPHYRSVIPDPHGPRPGAGLGLYMVSAAIRDVHEGTVVANCLPLFSRDDVRDPKQLNRQRHTTFVVTLSRNKLEALAREHASNAGERT